MNTELLTIGEGADLLRLRPSTLRAWILHRRIPYVKFSGRVFLRRSDVDALIEKGLVRAVLSPKCTGSGSTETKTDSDQESHNDRI